MFNFFLPVVGEDEGHSGHSSVDLFTEEELLPLSGPSFRTVTRPWPVSAKPKTSTENSTMTQSVLNPQLEESDSSLPVKMKMLNNSQLALAKAFQSTTENFTKHRALLSSATTDNFRTIWPTTHTTIQTHRGIEKEREKTTSQMMLNMESTSSHIKMTSNSASSEIRGNIVPSTVAAISSQSEVTMKTLTEQTHNTEISSRENFSQANEQNTLSSATPPPTTRSQATIIPEAYSTTIADEGSDIKTTAGITAITTDSGNTGTNASLTALHVNEGENDSITTASMTSLSSITTTMTNIKHKHNTRSNSLVKKQQGPKQKINITMAEEAIEEKPQRQPGKQTHVL